MTSKSNDRRRVRLNGEATELRIAFARQHVSLRRGSPVTPVGRGPRLFFQHVPEPKTVKNRVHLDLNVWWSLDAA